MSKTLPTAISAIVKFLQTAQISTNPNSEEREREALEIRVAFGRNIEHISTVENPPSALEGFLSRSPADKMSDIAKQAIRDILIDVLEGRVFDEAGELLMQGVVGKTLGHEVKVLPFGGEGILTPAAMAGYYALDEAVIGQQVAIKSSVIPLGHEKVALSLYDSIRGGGSRIFEVASEAGKSGKLDEARDPNRIVGRDGKVGWAH